MNTINKNITISLLAAACLFSTSLSTVSTSRAEPAVQEYRTLPYRGGHRASLVPVEHRRASLIPVEHRSEFTMPSSSIEGLLSEVEAVEVEQVEDRMTQIGGMLGAAKKIVAELKTKLSSIKDTSAQKGKKLKDMLQHELQRVEKLKTRLENSYKRAKTTTVSIKKRSEALKRGAEKAVNAVKEKFSSLSEKSKVQYLEMMKGAKMITQK